MLSLFNKTKQSITIKIVGLGGQGIVTTANILAYGAFCQNYWSQAIPFFGAEKTGTPVEAHIRIAQQPLQGYQPTEQLDILLINEPTLNQINGQLITIINQPNKTYYQAQKKILSYDGQKITKSALNKDLSIGLLGSLTALWPLINLQEWLIILQKYFSDSTLAQSNYQIISDHYHLAKQIINTND